MNYTRQQRRDLHKAFKAAESYVEKQGFLCWAVGEAHRAGKITESQQDLAKNLIEHRIHPYCTAELWLHNSAGIPVRELTSKAMEAYRKLWLATLVKEFSR